MNKNHYAVIMAGGVGSRFWPLSRQKHPKQFIDLTGQEKTLFQLTYERFSDIIPPENIYVVANEQYKQFIHNQVPSIKSEQILLEPHPRNTAPCIAYAAYKIHSANPKAVMVAAPSDHLIEDKSAFGKAILKSLEFAASGEMLVTLGIKPTHPDTGYGYIQLDEEQQHDDFYKVKTFTEKPNKELARYFLDAGEFLWNAGIFVWKTGTILRAFREHLPDMAEIFEKRKKSFYTSGEGQDIQKAYELCTNVSIDYGIMEKANNVFVTQAEFTWSDIGTWKSLFRLLKKDKNNNSVKGNKVLLRNSKHCIVNVPKNKVVALNNVSNLIVVESDGILLIADLEKEQEIRHVVNEARINWGDRFI